MISSEDRMRQMKMHMFHYVDYLSGFSIKQLIHRNCHKLVEVYMDRFDEDQGFTENFLVSEVADTFVLRKVNR